MVNTIEGRFQVKENAAAVSFLFNCLSVLLGSMKNCLSRVKIWSEAKLPRDRRFVFSRKSVSLDLSSFSNIALTQKDTEIGR